MASEQVLDVLMRRHVSDTDSALTLDPQAPDWTGRRLLRQATGVPASGEGA